MPATGSNDYEFADVMVPAEWTFASMRPRPPPWRRPVPAIPLWSQIGNGLAACAVGAARNMIDRFVELAALKVPAGRQTPVGRARARRRWRSVRHRACTRLRTRCCERQSTTIWARGDAGEPFDNDFLARPRLGSVTAVRLAARRDRSAARCRGHERRRARFRAGPVLAGRPHDDAAHHLVAGPVRDRGPGAVRARSRQSGHLSRDPLMPTRP